MVLSVAELVLLELSPIHMPKQASARRLPSKLDVSARDRTTERNKADAFGSAAGILFDMLVITVLLPTGVLTITVLFPTVFVVVVLALLVVVVAEAAAPLAVIQFNACRCDQKEPQSCNARQTISGKPNARISARQ
jgi:hypothetical protein